jgi:hypothetical protein
VPATSRYLTGAACSHFSYTQGLAELQTKLAKFILGLKTQSEMDMITGDQAPQSNGVVGAPSTMGGWSQPTDNAGWATTATPAVNGTAGSWQSPGRATSAWATSPSGAATGWGGTSPNQTTGWATSGSVPGWSSPSQQSGGWNV